jgi:hypothetical protein
MTIFFRKKSKDFSCFFLKAFCFFLIMQAENPRNTKSAKRNIGLSIFSREQDVTVTHAWRVVTGRRESRRLLAAWKAFKAQKEASK